MKGIGWDLARKLRGKPWVVFQESFTGDGTTKTFTLDGTILNATLLSGVWNASNVQITKSVSVTKNNGKALYDSTNIFTRHRITVSSVNAVGVVTLDYAPINEAVFYVYYWYELPNGTRLEDYYRDDIVSKFEADEPGAASSINVNTTLFGGILDSEDDTVQKALDTIDDHGHIAEDIIIPGGIGTPSYDDMQDFLQMTRSAGRLTGGNLSAYVSPPTPDGIVSISELEGIIFTTNVLGGDYIFFKQAAGTVNLTGLADNTVYWIYFDWNGGSPQYAATSVRANIHEYDQFPIGTAWRSGNNIEVIDTGHNIYNQDRRSHNRLVLKYGIMDRVSGGVISAHATALRLTCTAGTWYVADYPYTTDASDTFYVWYKSGSSTWVKSSELTLFSDIFNGDAATVYEYYQDGDNLSTIGLNKYGVYWIFLCPKGDLYAVLGTATYSNIGSAQASTVPSFLPPYLVNWGMLIGRVICQNARAAFYSIESVWSNGFTLSTAVDHASLSSLAWSASGHTIDADVDMATHQLVNLSVPDAAGEAIRQTAKITEEALEAIIDTGGGGIALSEVLTWSTL